MTDLARRVSARLALAGWLGSLVLAGGGCRALDPEFHCQRDDQCVHRGGPGRCEPSGFCSATDDQCGSGHRYLPASGSLGGQCVGASIDGGIRTDTGGTARVLWRGDVEEGTLVDWWSPSPVGQDNGSGGEDFSKKGSTSVASTVRAHGGRYAAHQRIDTSSGGTGTELLRWAESETHPRAYYSAWYYLPQKVAHIDGNGWWELMLFKSENESGDVNNILRLMLSYTYDPNQMYLKLRVEHIADSGHDDASQRQAAIPVGRWFHLEVLLEQSATGSGRVAVWQDGIKIIDRSKVTTRYSGAKGANRWAITDEGGRLKPAIVEGYVDDAAVSLDRLGP